MWRRQFWSPMHKDFKLFHILRRLHCHPSKQPSLFATNLTRSALHSCFSDFRHHHPSGHSVLIHFLHESKLSQYSLFHSTIQLSLRFSLSKTSSFTTLFVRVTHNYLDTWSSFEAAKTAPWRSRGLHHFGKFLEPSDKWAGRGCCCFLMRWHSWTFLLIRNELQKFVELKFEFFSFNTFDVSQIFSQRVVQPRPKYSYCIFLQGLCWVSVCWMLNDALCSMSWVFSGFYFVPHRAINIWHHMPCFLLNIYYNITFTASLKRVQFELVLSFPVV